MHDPTPPPPLVELTYFPGPPTQVSGGAVWAAHDWTEVEPYLQSKTTDAPAKDGSGYWTACGLDGGRRRDGAARPTRIIALDWDVDGSEPDWAALTEVGPYVAHTTATHLRVDARTNPTGAPRWRVWLLLAEAADALTVRRARSPWLGAVLRGISQPAFVPTTGTRTEWRSGGAGPGVRLADWAETPAPAAAAPAPAPAGAQPPWDRDSVRAMLARGDHTNLKAGGIGRCLYRWGYSPEYARAYVVALLTELRHPAPRRHGDSAAAACGPLSTAWGVPKLLEQGVTFETTPASEIEVARPLTIRYNPDDRARPWFVWSSERGVWEAACAQDAERCAQNELGALSTALWALPTPKRVRLRSALMRDHELNVLHDDALDAESELLAVPGVGSGGAVVDLRTGAARAAEPEDYVSRQCGVPVVGGARTQAGATASERVFLDWAGGSQALAEYLWSACGYAATGEAREKTMWVFYGEPDTGKTTFVNHVAACLGTYAVSVPVDTWLSGTSKNNVDESLGRVRGSTRLVISPELPSGQTFNISRVTAFTGGDELTAAGKWKAERAFTPRAKLWIAGNYPPATSGYQASFVSRLRVVPFTHAFPRAPAFARTLEGLRGETLGRIVAEAKRYLAQGLRPAPEAVTRASAEATDESDVLGQWLGGLKRGGERTQARRLFESWRKRGDAGRYLETEHAFGRAMRRFAREFPKVKDNAGLMTYLNLTVER